MFFFWGEKIDCHMAPEVLKYRRYDKKVDVFSFAMILYEVMLHPWDLEFCLIKFEASSKLQIHDSWNPSLVQMLEGEPPFSNYEPYDGAKYVAEGHRPSFRGKGYIPELRE